MRVRCLAVIGIRRPMSTPSWWVFVRSGSTWTQRQRLLAPDQPGQRAFRDRCGLDGRTMIIGAFRDGSGSAHVYWS